MNIYHRIYKLYQRKIPAQQIAATTHMPLKSVREILNKFEGKGAKSKKVVNAPELVPYLDFHITKHHKYILIDFSGFFTTQFKQTVIDSIAEIRQQLGQTLAIKLHEVVELDEDAMNVLTSFHKELHKIGKSLTILSPSHEVEQFIHDHGLEESIKVFGTLNAFEEFAFRTSH